MKYIRTLLMASLLAPLLLLGGCVKNEDVSVQNKPVSTHGTMYGTEDPNDTSGIPQSIIDGEEEI